MPGANSAWLAASILALDDPELSARLADQRAAMAAKVQAKSEAAGRKLPELLGD